jgi:hypothetical protein
MTSPLSKKQSDQLRTYDKNIDVSTINMQTVKIQLEAKSIKQLRQLAAYVKDAKDTEQQVKPNDPNNDG